MGQHERRVRVHDQQLGFGVSTGRPRTRPCVRPGGPQPGQPTSVSGDAVQHPPGGRGRGHRAEQLRLVAQDRQVGKAVTAVGQHHRQVPQHCRVGVATPSTRLLPAQRLGQPNPVGQLPQQRCPGMAHHPGGISGDFEAGRPVGSLHPQGALLEPGCDLQTAAFSLLERAPCVPGRAAAHTSRKAEASRPTSLAPPLARAVSRHATVSTVPQFQGQGRPPGQASGRGRTMTEAAVSFAGTLTDDPEVR
jgi:hypothetical protein